MEELYIFKKVEDSLSKLNRLLDQVEETKKNEKQATLILKSLLEKVMIHQIIIKSNRTFIRNELNTLNGEFGLEYQDNNQWEFNNNFVLKQLESENIATESLVEIKDIYKFDRNNKYSVNQEIKNDLIIEIENSYISESKDYIYTSFNTIETKIEETLESIENLRLMSNNITIIINNFGKNNRKDILTIKKYFQNRIMETLIDTNNEIKSIESKFSIWNTEKNKEYDASDLYWGKKDRKLIKEDLETLNDWKKSIYGGKTFLAASNGNIAKDFVNKIMEEISQTYINYIIQNKNNDFLLNKSGVENASIKLNRQDLKFIIKNITSNKNSEWNKLIKQIELPELNMNYNKKKTV